MKNESLLQGRYNETVIQRLRIQLGQVLLAFLMVVGLLIGASISLGNVDISSMSLGGSAVIAVVAGILLFLLTRRLYVNTILNIILVVFLVLSFGIEDFNVLIISSFLTAIAAALLAPRVGYYIINGLIIALIIWFGLTRFNVLENTANLVLSLGTLSIGLVPIVVGILIRYFTATLESTANDAQRYANLLEASANIGQNMSQMLELNELLSRAVEIVRDRFAIYHVQVFLVDEEQTYAYLTASTGDVGQQMLARQHRLTIDSNSVIGRVAQSSEAIIARDTDRESGHAFNELLPDTRSELGLPIKDNQGVIGALDLQSRRSNAFTETEIRVLQVIANQLATAIRNARLFANQERNLQENKRLFIDSETNLREIQRLNRQLTKQVWQDYLVTNRRVEGVTLTAQGFRNRAEWTDSMNEAGQRRRPIRSQEGEIQRVAVPIELRGEVVGAIEIETHTKREYDDMVEMVQAISQRLGVSLDNARLFEETNEATAQEQRIGELVSRYQSAETVDDLLKITIEGLAETLGADLASIRLGVIPDDFEEVEQNGESA